MAAGITFLKEWEERRLGMQSSYNKNQLSIIPLFKDFK